MPYHIHTIPVIDALRDPKGCAFCAMYGKLQEDAIQFVLGPAYMEEDVRTETNRLGFCQAHLTAMYAEKNRLGFALMLHTYMRQLNKDISTIISSKQRAPLFGKDINGPLAKIHGHLAKAGESCYVCNKVESTFDGYIDTFLHLWGKGGEDAALIKSQKGYCLPHFTKLVAAADKLGRSKREKFIDEILLPQLKYMQELEEDLEWFTLKFDYRYANEPWKNAKDALPRALGILGTKEK